MVTVLTRDFGEIGIPEGDSWSIADEWGRLHVRDEGGEIVAAFSAPHWIGVMKDAEE